MEESGYTAAIKAISNNALGVVGPSHRYSVLLQAIVTEIPLLFFGIFRIFCIVAEVKLLPVNARSLELFE